MKRVSMCVAAVALSALSISAAEILVVVEKSRIERWETGPKEWRKTGVFLDGKAAGLKPVSVTATAGGKVYVACEDQPTTGSIEEFDAKGGHVRTLARLAYRPFTLMAHPDGKRLVQAHNSNNVKAYSLPDGKESDYIGNAPIYTRCVRFGPDGNCWLSTPYYSSVSAFDDTAKGAPRKVGEIAVYACNGGFDFGGADLTRLIVPSSWYESVDLVSGVTDVSYPTDVTMRWCQATVRVGGEVYAADFAQSRIVHVPSAGGPVTVVAQAPGCISGMWNLTETLDGSERRRFAAAGAKLKAKGTRLFTDGLPKLPDGTWDLERMKFNNPGLEVDLSVGIWPFMRILTDGICISSTSVPRELTRRFDRKDVTHYGAGVDTSWAKVPGAANARRPPYGEPPGASCHFRKYHSRERHFADLTGDGRPDCIELYSDWSEYGVPGPACPVAYDAEERWTNNQIQVFAYLHERTGDGAAGKWLAPVPILCDGKKDLQGSFACGGAVLEDFNGDGLVDMIAGDFRSEIWFYANVGTKERPAFARGRHPVDPSGRPIEGLLCMMSLQGHDQDGDGRTDLVVSEEDGRVSWFRNVGEVRDGVPVFAAQEFFRQEADELKFGCLATPFAVDWDGDGDEDLIAGDSAGHIAFIENLSGRGAERPKWAEPKLFTVLDPKACTAELWLDGNVIRAKCGDVNSPQGPAEAKWGYTVLSVADWDGDGFLDIMANDVKGSVVLIRNPGRRGTTAMEAPCPVEVEWEGEQPRFAWEWRKPTGRVLRAMWRTTPLMYDWNGDGLVDLIMLDHEGHLALYPRARRGGKLVLLPPQRVFLDENGQSKSMCGEKGGSGRRKFCITDWNGDGRPDFVFQEANAYALLNLGTDADGRTRFSATRQFARKRLAGHTCCPTACDFNADGVPDLVIGAEDGHFYYFRNPRAKETAKADAKETSKSGEFVIAVRGQAPLCALAVEAQGPSAEYAAQELRNYVRRLTGVDLPAGGLPRRIVLAPGDAALGDDGFAIEATADELRISGGRRGVLFGVYEVLTRFGGVEWFSSWCEEVPRLERLAVPAGYRDSQKPAIPVREIFWTDVTCHSEFAARLRTNNRSWQRDDPRTGGNAWRFGGGLVNCHTFNTLVPPEKYFKDHPEYFSEVNGRRLGERTQLCLTNPDVLAIATSNVLAAIRRDPTAECFGVSQNDWYNFCTCAKCKAVDDAEGSHAGTMIAFVNRIAEAVKAVAPDKTVETLAYQYTRTPPKTVKPRDNVMVCLCSIECDFSKPITKSRYHENVKFLDDIRKWGAMTKKLYIWDYTTNYENYQMPHPNVNSLQSNIRFFRDNNAYFLFEQGVHRSYHGDFAELKAWLMSKWMWNPDQPGKPLLDRFLRGYYGAAAPYVREHLKRLHAFRHDEEKRPLKSFTALGGHESSTSGEFLEWALGNWRKAERAVAGDPVRTYNVRTSSLPIDYILFNRLYKRVNLVGDGDFDAWRPVAEHLAATVGEVERAGRSITFCEDGDKSAKRWSVITNALAGTDVRIGDGYSAWQEESALAFSGASKCGGTVDDPAASGGKALWLNNDNYQWYTQYHLDDVAFAPGEEYVLSVRLRAKPTGEPGEVVRIGVHDSGNAKGGGVRSFRAKDIKEGYADYEVLTWTPASGQMLYIAPGHFDVAKQAVSTAHEGIWIDGFRLTRKSGKKGN